MADIDALFKEVEQKSEQRRKALEDRNARLQADDRSRIAKQIIDAFVLIVIGVIALVGISALFGLWNQMSEAAKVMVAVLSSVLLPVVTLVIGYYFGNK
jgi:hypothetical protein